MKKHFVALDGLRGTAALSVAILHITGYVNGNPALFHAFMAVGFFFMLSGFVVAHAYEQRLLSDMDFMDFAKRRVVRLWPLIVAGLVLGACYLLARNHLQPTHAVTMGYLLAAIAFGLILVPLNIAVGGDGYPLDLPAWSLFFEMIANLFYAFLCRRRLISGLVLAIIIGCSLLARLVDSHLERWDMVNHFTNRFALEITFLNGLSRVGFGFFLGVALYRYRNHRFIRRIPQLHSMVASLLLVLLFAVPPFSSNTYDLIVAGLVMPVILAASTHHDTQGLEGSICEFSGWLSYPLYVVHYPVMFAAVGAFKYLGLVDRLPEIAIEVLTLVCAIIVAYLLGKFYDQPARAWLAARIHTKPSGPHLGAADPAQPTVTAVRKNS